MAKYGRDAKKRCPASPEKVYAECEKRILSRPLTAAQALVVILIIVGFIACCCGCFWVWYCCNKRKGGYVTSHYSSGSHGHKSKMKRKRRKKQKVNSFDVSSFESYSSYEIDLEYVGDGGVTYGEPGYAVEGATTVIVVEGNQQEVVVVEEPIEGEVAPEGTPRESPGDEVEPEQEPEEEEPEPEPEYDQEEEPEPEEEDEPEEEEPEEGGEED